MNDSHSELESDVDAIMVQVLCVFAARGRAIREGSANLVIATSVGGETPEVPGDQEANPSDREKSAKTPGL
jgi:hypothetical protein